MRESERKDKVRSTLATATSLDIQRRRDASVRCASAWTCTDDGCLDRRSPSRARTGTSLVFIGIVTDPIKHHQDDEKCSSELFFRLIDRVRESSSRSRRVVNTVMLMICKRFNRLLIEQSSNFRSPLDIFSNSQRNNIDNSRETRWSFSTCTTPRQTHLRSEKVDRRRVVLVLFRVAFLPFDSGTRGYNRDSINETRSLHAANVIHLSTIKHSFTSRTRRGFRYLIVKCAACLLALCLRLAGVWTRQEVTAAFALQS